MDHPGPVLSFLPTLLIGILFGLAMDYQMFLVTGMREAYVHGKDTATAIVSGYNHAVRVVVAAAIIMIRCLVASSLLTRPWFDRWALAWRSACSWMRSLCA